MAGQHATMFMHTAMHQRDSVPAFLQSVDFAIETIRQVPLHSKTQKKEEEEEERDNNLQVVSYLM